MENNEKYLIAEEETIILCSSCHAAPPTKSYPEPIYPDFNAFLASTMAYSRETLEATAQDLLWFTAEIQRLRDTLEKLERQCSYAQRQHDLIKASLAPIRTVPVEVLSEIFSVYCMDQVIDIPITDCHPADILSAVCSQWRVIVNNTPEIWSYLNVTCPLGPKSPYLREESETILSRKGLTRCLTMSKNAPLHVTLLSPYTEFKNGSSLLELALAHSQRWKCADLEIFPYIASTFVEFLHTSRERSQEDLFFALRKLHVSAHDLYISLDQTSFPLLRSSIPQLEEFSFSCQRAAQMPYGPTTLYKLFIDTEITRLEVFDQFQDEDLAFLDELTALRKMHLWKYVGARALPSLKMHTASSLKHLVIRVYIPLFRDAVLSLFSGLTLPALTSLEVSQFGFSPNVVWDKVAFDSMIQRSGCVLHSLYLEEIQIGFEELRTLIQAVPMLRDLTFCEYSKDKSQCSVVGSQLCRLLTWNAVSPSSSLLPNLKDIELRVYSSLDDDFLDIISDLVISRTSSLSMSSSSKAVIESGLQEYLSYFRLHSLGGSAIENIDSVMRRLENEARSNIPNCSGVSFRIIVPPDSEASDDSSSSTWSDDSSVVITEDSQHDRQRWEEDFPSDQSDIVAEEEGSSEPEFFPLPPAATGEILLRRYYDETEG
ncbi:hypothetical protein VKT23_007736 [Stygiomarasmius scandens]|uniref:F-box domain-containing protein n=1 Tax=Marasmiellus scandens TaxID=2682957 RepID=A0ABR1JKZ6_9AGAR